MKRKLTTGMSLLITLLMITSVLTTGTTIANGEENGVLEVVKHVSNGENWVDYIEALVGDTVQFKITVTYHNISGNGYHDHVDNIVVTDILPPGLQYAETQQPPAPEPQIEGNQVIWAFPSNYQLYNLDSICIIFNATVIGYGESINTVNATAIEHCCNEPIWGEDIATVFVNPSVDVDKKVWDPVELQWVDVLNEVRLNQLLRFRITVTYHGVDTMKCLVVKDVLPGCCLEFMNGVEITYPHQGFDDPVTTIDENEITWDWTTTTFNLDNGESIIIEFDAKVVEYCGGLVENLANASLSGCGGCEPVLYDEDTVSINCEQPQTKFEKKVFDMETQKWVDETTAVVGSHVEFKLKLTYYGESQNATFAVVDNLPCCLEYDGSYADPPVSNVSADNKTMWWNFTTHLEDSETVVLRFKALVLEEFCCEGINHADLTLTVCGEESVDYDDTAKVIIRDNTPPGYPILYGPTTGSVDKVLSFTATAYDAEDDNVYYKFDWGNEISTWMGPYPQGVEKIFTHSWPAAGTYEVKAKAMDIYGAESISWSNVITVVITSDEPQPGNITITNIKGGLNKITATIKNDGSENSILVNWTIQVEGKIGFLKGKNVETKGNMTLDAGKTSDAVGAGQAKRLGFGRTTITVIADAENYGYDEVEKNGIVVGPFIIIR